MGLQNIPNEERYWTSLYWHLRRGMSAHGFEYENTRNGKGRERVIPVVVQMINCIVCVPFLQVHGSERSQLV